MSQKNDLPKLYYVYDPLCGWCYGFSPVIMAIHQKYGHRVHIEVIAGGMVRGDRVGPIGQVAPFIKSAYKTVEQHCGVKFGQAFLQGVLEPGTMLFSSEMPCRATVCIKQLKPEVAVAFAHDLQKAIYYHGEDLGQLSSYKPILEKYQISVDAFERQMHDPATLSLTEQGYQKASELGVNGFPTLIFEKNGQRKTLAVGYKPMSEIERHLQKLLD